MATPQTHKKPVVNFLRAYKFRETEKDPIIDRIHTLMDDTGYKIADIVRHGGPSYGTISNWIDGPTRRPQYATLCAAIRSMGYDFAIVQAPKNRVVNGNGKAWDAAMPAIVKRFR